MNLTEEQKKNLRQWVAALRSGYYQQTKALLFNPDDGGYCCLGVACETQKLPKSFAPRADHFNGYVFKSESETLQSIFDGAPDSNWFTEKFGFDFDKQFEIKQDGEVLYSEELINLNDEKGFTFTQIADLLEVEFLK